MSNKKRQKINFCRFFIKGIDKNIKSDIRK